MQSSANDDGGVTHKKHIRDTVARESRPLKKTRPVPNTNRLKWFSDIFSFLEDICEKSVSAYSLTTQPRKCRTLQLNIFAKTSNFVQLFIRNVLSGKQRLTIS